LMSPNGTKRTYRLVRAMSAFGGKPDMAKGNSHFR
jgi:hypothetical protein